MLILLLNSILDGVTVSISELFRYVLNISNPLQLSTQLGTYIALMIQKKLMSQVLIPNKLTFYQAYEC